MGGHEGSVIGVREKCHGSEREEKWDRKHIIILNFL